MFRNGAKIFFLVVLQLALFASLQAPAADASSSLRGIVLDEKGLPIKDAAVQVWSGKNLIASVMTGGDGLFSLDVKAGDHYVVYVFADDETTPGVDYLPARLETTPDGNTLRLTLMPAASLVLDGNIQFVESEELPLSVEYTVIDPRSSQPMVINGFTLRYGSTVGAQSSYLDLEPYHLVVPAGVPFKVNVNCSILIGSELGSHSFEAGGSEPFLLERGEKVELDVKRYSLPLNFAVADGLKGRVEARIGEMEPLGFYLNAEKTTVSYATKLLSEARYYYGQNRFVESFDSAKRSYIALRQTLSDLTALYSDAAASVYVLIFFLSFTSVAIAFLLSNRNLTKISGSLVSYAASLAVLYFIYPGSVMIPIEFFAWSAFLSIATALAAAFAVPRFLKGRGGEHVPVRNILVPLFSIAKRNLRRRSLRFALTLASVTVLVMSFVALTSFSEGYGLVISRVSIAGTAQKGVLLRAQGYMYESPVFMTLTDVNSGWLERQPESRVVSPKAENFPFIKHITSLNGAPIFGVIGLYPELESSIIDLKATLREGSLPTEDGVMISETLRNRLSVNINDTLTLGSMRVRLQGVFDDEAFRGIKDLDDGTYLPPKLVNISPEGEAPNYVPEPCETSEIVVTHMSTALQIPLVGISRVDLAVDGSADVNAFAERLALERGYMAWSSSPDGVYLARLGSFFEGKGASLLIPWAIVVLNVVVTMLNSLYERRGEIHILSSVGLNPAQIAAIFVAEASIIGVIAGGVGYMAGSGLYRAMIFFNVALEVHQKVSAAWSLSAVAIAMTAVLIGALVALRGSVVITPSLTRRWRIEKESEDFSQPWELPIPVKFLPEEAEGLAEFMVGSLKAREDDPVRRTSSIKVSMDACVFRIDFVYKDSQSLTGGFYTKNTLFIERGSEEVSLRLISSGQKSSAHITGTLIRLLTMEWSTLRGRVDA